MQLATGSNNSKEFYTLMKKAFGPKMVTVMPLRSKNGNEMFTSMTGIIKCQKQHFLKLLNKDSQVDSKAIVQVLEQQTVMEVVNNPLSLEEVELSISMLNVGNMQWVQTVF